MNHESIHFIANNRHYVAQVNAPTSGQMLGHAGQEFTIRFDDGRELISRNVWWSFGTPVPPEGAGHATMTPNWPPTFRHGWQEQEVPCV